MNRRHFLHSLALAAAALQFDPERLLWTPGKKKIFIPPARASYPNFWNEGFLSYHYSPLWTGKFAALLPRFRPPAVLEVKP